MSNITQPISQPQRLAPIGGPELAQYWYQWFLEVCTKLNTYFVVAAGQTTLVAGVKVVSIKGITADNLAFVSLATGAGTLALLQGTCDLNKLTITSVNTDLSTQTLDTSTVNYVIHDAGN